MVASYEYQSMVFYDTKDVFDRHNFARQLKRNLLEEDYVIEKNKYYLSKIGIVTYAVKTGHSKFIDAMMNILESPAADEFSHPPSAPPSHGIHQVHLQSHPQSFHQYQPFQQPFYVPQQYQYHYQQHPHSPSSSSPHFPTSQDQHGLYYPRQ